MKPTAKQKKYIVMLGGFLGKAATRQEASSVIDALQNDAVRARQDLNSRWGGELAMREQLERIEELGGVPVPNASMTAAAMQIDGLARKLSAEQARVTAQQKAEFDANPFWGTRQAVEELIKRRSSLQERRTEEKRQISQLKKEAERLTQSSTNESEEAQDHVFDLEMEQEPIEESISSIEDELEDLKDELRLASRLREDFWLACFGKEFMGEYPTEQCPNYNPAVSRAYEELGLVWQVPARRDVVSVLSDLDQHFTEWDKYNPAQIYFREFEKRFPEKRKGLKKAPQRMRPPSAQMAESKKGCFGVFLVLLVVAGLTGYLCLLVAGTGVQAFSN